LVSAKAVLSQLNETLKNNKLSYDLINESKNEFDKLNVYENILSSIFGKNNRTIHFFNLHNQNELKLTWKEKPEINENEMFNWLNGNAKVRTGLKALQTTETLFYLFQSENLTIMPMQLTRTKLNYWVGGNYPENPDPTIPADNAPTGDVLSLIMQLPDSSFLDNTDFTVNTGLIVDDWVELIPNHEETTGVAFHYDQPNAKPPQSLLLAVTPVVSGKWKWQDLNDSILETIELAKTRAVEPDQLTKTTGTNPQVLNADDTLFAHIIPGIMAEISKYNQTISSFLSSSSSTSNS
jgi:hypothetical protein